MGIWKVSSRDFAGLCALWGLRRSRPLGGGLSPTSCASVLTPPPRPPATASQRPPLQGRQLHLTSKPRASPLNLADWSLLPKAPFLLLQEHRSSLSAPCLERVISVVCPRGGPSGPLHALLGRSRTHAQPPGQLHITFLPGALPRASSHRPTWCPVVVTTSHQVICTEMGTEAQEEGGRDA